MTTSRTNTTRKKRTHRTASAAEANVTSAASTRWLTAGVLALFAFASVVSFSGLYGTGPWLRLPPFLYLAVPLFIDLAIIIYKFAEIKLRLDPRKQHLSWKAKMGVLIGTVVSSAGNVFHVLNGADPDPVRLYGGMALAGLSPWFIYLAASVLTDIVVKPKPRKVQRETPVPVTAQSVAPKRRQAPAKTVPTSEPEAAEVRIPARESQVGDTRIRNGELQTLTSITDGFGNEIPRFTMDVPAPKEPELVPPPVKW